MSKLYVDADAEYARLLSDPDKTMALSFLRREADSFINIQHLLSCCNNDDEYNRLLPQMLEYLSHIRTTKIDYLNEQFHFYQFTARKYLSKLLKEYER